MRSGTIISFISAAGIFLSVVATAQTAGTGQPNLPAGKLEGQNYSSSQQSKGGDGVTGSRGNSNSRRGTSGYTGKNVMKGASGMSGSTGMRGPTGAKPSTGEPGPQR